MTCGVTLHLFERRERMDRGELRPGDRDHLGRGIQLHRAGAERNHRAIEPDVLPLEALQVAHHLRFRTMRRENRMRHERRLAREAGRQIARRLRRCVMRGTGFLPPLQARRRSACTSRKRRRFVERDADVTAVEVPEIQPGPLGDRLDRHGCLADAFGHLEPQRVEVRRRSAACSRAIRGAFRASTASACVRRAIAVRPSGP